MALTLLVELLTEELPPKSLRALADAFASALVAALREDGFLSGKSVAGSFATPRRLAVSITDVHEKSPDRQLELIGPSVKAPPQAVAGFARKNGVPVADLTRIDTPKGEVFAYRRIAAGSHLATNLALRVEEALKRLPVAKLMRWGSGDAQFVRPAHGLVMMHGRRVVPGRVLGLESTNRTEGHRFMGKGTITLTDAAEYEARLREDGMVIPDFADRREEIERQLKAAAGREKAALGAYEDLLDEVTALVEHPSIYAGSFDAAYLEVPQECLILTMRQNQKYFPLFDGASKLLPRFLIVSNMKVADPRHIIGGNERVVRPRLEDARFFYDQDRKVRLETRVPQLGKVIYHNKLGSQLERVERMQLLTGIIARALKADALQAERAAWLSKADLLTGMVGEFPQLQGVMGRYYALNDGEPRAVADAIEAHYRPRFAGDRLPEGEIACALALADKLDALAGMFGIGQQPTGEKDPFGLRRAALGVVRILVERALDLPLPDLLSSAFGTHAGKVRDARSDLQAFILERFAGYLKDQGFSTLQVESVLSQNPGRLHLVPQQLEAVRAFQALPEAESLAAANKRVANILRQAAAKGESFDRAERKALKEPAELALFSALEKTRSNALPMFERGDYTGYLRSFAVLKKPVDAFFDSVMVMVDDAKLRQSRLALLNELRDAMNRVADISKLAQ
ncbi:MAG TPA: glycine--tRNA ligase subunit beta [Burkholderiales bacterium]|nr:glycine--tRNA ligase subunit beta [Burkholderiales bacterium]